MRAKAVAGVAAIGATLSFLAPSIVAADDVELPNLVAMPASRLTIGKADSGTEPALRFATSVANRGDHALELTGEPSSTEAAKASQCVEWAGPRLCEKRQQVGEFIWHPEHRHYHLDNFALYELRKTRRNGSADMSKRGLIATSGKISFCVIDVEEDDESQRELPYLLPYPGYYTCFTGIGMQGISPGWKDVYSPTTTGQQIVLTGIRDGRYALVETFDPKNQLLETHEDDNVSAVYLEILDAGRKVEVLCESVPGTLNC